MRIAKEPHGPQRPAKSQGGFTLVEALFAMVIVGIVFTALYSAMASSQNTAQLAREDSRATQILIEKMDKLRLLTWDQLNDNTVVPDKFWMSFDPEDSDFGGDGLTNLKGAGKYKKMELLYTGKITVANGPADVTYGTNMATVTIDLSWTSRTGMDRARSLTTYFAQNGEENYAY
jgi:prepilin-type N-terminal cleavage/methylation domain-containing protein